MTTDGKRIDHLGSHRNFCCGLARTNLDTCFIFVGLAKRELETGKRGQAERSFGRAQCSYEATLQLLNSVGNERNEVHEKTERLGEELDFLRQQLSQAA